MTLSFSPIASGNTGTHDVLPESSFSNWIDAETSGGRITARPAVASAARIAGEPAQHAGESSPLYDDMRHDWHPIATIWPMMSDADLHALADDIKNNGLHHDIILFEGKVLIGRNRLASCRIAGVTPRFVEFQGTHAQAVSRVWSDDGLRRHATPSQLAAADARRRRLCSNYAAELDAMKAEATERQADGRKAGGKARHQLEGTNSPKLPKESGKVREQRAKAAGTNPKYIDAADKLEENRPDLVDKVIQGRITIPQAQREMESTAIASQPEVKGRVKDGRGQPVPERLEKVFQNAGELKAISKEVLELRKRFDVVSKSSGVAWLDTIRVRRDFENIRKAISYGAAYCPCQSGRMGHKSCPDCKGMEYVSKARFEKRTGQDVQDGETFEGDDNNPRDWRWAIAGGTTWDDRAFDRDMIGPMCRWSNERASWLHRKHGGTGRRPRNHHEQKCSDLLSALIAAVSEWQQAEPI